MSIHRSTKRLALVLSCLLALAAGISSTLYAQTSTGTIRGFVRDSSGAGIVEAEVIAKDTATNITRSVTTHADGFYNLGGLTPAVYDLSVRRVGMSGQTRRLRVQIGQTVPADFTLSSAVVALEEVTITTSAEARSTEAATNVTQQQIEQLPSPSRNFLDLAALAPGTRVDVDRVDGTGKSFSAGALPSASINVFVDGASYKNDLSGTGGVAGQDASRGNAFPRLALQEFRIITNNYKAEYQKASSAIITATTKSGTNIWQASTFFSGTGQGLLARDTFDIRNKVPKRQFDRYLTGMSLGGPLIHDKLFLFGTYEGNYQNRDAVTIFRGDSLAWPAAFKAQNGQLNNAAFRENSFFVKLTWNRSQRQALELTTEIRHESDLREFGNQFAGPDVSFEHRENFRNNVYTGTLKHSLFGQLWLNEAQVSWQRYQFNQEPGEFNLVGQNFFQFGRIGGRDSRQDLVQKRLSFRDDLTYSGFRTGGSHVLKVGANVDFLHYNVLKQFNENPTFNFDFNVDSAKFPISAVYGVGNPDLSNKNTQLGLYAQDDWSPSQRLTFNLGVRWDVETGMTDRSFVTPQAVRDSITAAAPTLFVNIPASRYFTNGHDRKPFYGAVQPRAGVSYALDQNARTTIFASVGVFYDRDAYNSFVDEKFQRQHPILTFHFDTVASGSTIKWDPSLMNKHALDSLIANGQAPPSDVFLNPNDLRVPRSNQWTIGLRHDFGGWTASASYNGIRSTHGYTFEFANLTLQPNGVDCCIAHNLPAYNNILVGNDNVRTWYDAMYLTVDRPYRKTGRIGWGAGLAYTLAKAEAEGGDLFSFPQVALNPRHPTNSDERHRVVMNWVTDIPYLFGFQLAGLITLGSGTPFDVNNFSVPGFPVVKHGAGRPKKYSFIIPNAWAYREVDLSLRKDFPHFAGRRLGLTLDVFNVLNYRNFGCFNNDEASPDFKKPGCLISDPRRAQIGARFDW
jgi:outer membrane receptor protein involved in Fe transport